MKLRLVFLVSFLLSFCLNAQIFQNASRQLSTNPAQYALSGFNIRYAEMRGNLRMGLDLGFRPSYCNGCKIEGNTGIAGEYPDQNFSNYNYNGLTLGAFFDTHSKTGSGFLSMQPYFRYWWFNNKEIAYDNVEGYSFSGLRSETNRLIGIRLMAGSAYNLWAGKETRGTVDISVGPGLMYRWTRYTTHRGFIYQDPVEDFTEKHQRLVHPVLHFRLDFTVTLLKKE
jgi:hypothetical protein